MTIYRLKFLILVFFSFCLFEYIYPQSISSDSSFHPYHVNYWVTGSNIVVGIVLEKVGFPWISNKSTITITELQNLDRHDITPFDRWALNFDPTNMEKYEILSNQLEKVVVFLPALTMLDKNIRHDWLDILLMYMQTQTIANNIYMYSPFGATFQNRLRPIVYYDYFGVNEVRVRGANRNSLYSGHTSATAAASFFTAKIFCDYHPELGWNKYLVYGAAAIPPLIMSYFRLRALAHFPTDVMIGFGVGALCGIMIPEFHRMQGKDISLDVYSTSEATGIAVKWQPGFLK